MKTNFTIRFGSQIKSFSSRKWISALVLGLSLLGNGYGQDSLVAPINLDPCLTAIVELDGSNYFGETVSWNGVDYYQKFECSVTGGVVRSANINWKIENGTAYFEEKNKPAGTLKTFDQYAQYDFINNPNFFTKSIYIKWDNSVKNGTAQGRVYFTLSRLGFMGWSSLLTCDPKFRELYVYKFSSTCGKPALNSKTICESQYLYNCNAGQTYTFNPIIGSVYTPNSDRKWRYRWGLSLDAGKTWKSDYVTTSEMYNASDKNTDFNSPSFTKNWSGNVEVFTIGRTAQEKYSIGLQLPYFHDKEYTNTVNLVLSPCSDPFTIPISINGPEKLKCGDQSVNYSLDFNQCGVKNITWKLPNTWTPQGPTSGQWATNIGAVTYPWTQFGNNKPAGGDVVAIIEFFDGKIRTVTKSVSVDNVLDVNVSKTEAVLCQYQESELFATASNGSGNYTYTWDKWYAKCNPNNSCASVKVKGVDIAWLDFDYITVKATDNVTGCFASKTITLLNPYKSGSTKDTWAQYSIYTKGLAQQSVKAGTNISVDDLGQPYYVGANGRIWTYTYNKPASYWVNNQFTNTSNAGNNVVYKEISGTKYLYYYKTTNNFIYRLNLTTNLEEQQPSSGFSNCLKVNGTDVYYRTIDNFISKFDNKLFQVAANSNFEIVYNKIYFVNLAGIISIYDLSTGVTTQLSGWNNVVLPGSDIVYQGGNVFYVDNEKKIRYVSTTYTITETNANVSCNGKFSINQNTGVVYYGGNDKNIYQLFFQNSYWNTPLLISVNYDNEKPIGDASQVNTLGLAGAVAFSLPNCFYVANDGKVKTVQFATTSACLLKNGRTESDEGDHLPIETNDNIAINTIFTAYPNPAENNVTFSINVSSEETSVSGYIANSFGERVATIAENKSFSKGIQYIDLALDNLPKGLYFATVYLSNNQKETIKLILK